MQNVGNMANIPSQGEMPDNTENNNSIPQNPYNMPPQQPWNDPNMQQYQPYAQNPQMQMPYPYPYPYPPPYPYPYPPMPPYPPMQEGGFAGYQSGEGPAMQEGPQDDYRVTPPAQPVEEEKMTLDQFKAKQKNIQDVKEKRLRQKFRIVGSRESIRASALDGGVYVAGNKVYKWGDIRKLDE